MFSPNRIPLFVVVVLILSILSGCTKSAHENENAYLIRVGTNTVSILDFKRALEFAKTAYPHNVMQNPDVTKSISIRVLNQLTEELLLIQKAQDLKIQVSDEEVEAKVAEVRKDYPDDEFEKTFLENAVSLEAWKKRLKVRLIMEKVIESELEGKIKITPQDITDYYKAHYADDVVQPAEGENNEELNKLIVKNIRREKAEEAYKNWILNIRKEYTVEINKEAWNRIVNSENPESQP